MRGQRTDWQIYDSGGRRKYVSGSERRRFMRAVRALPIDRRLLCLILAFTGCRVSEALSLARHQIDRDRSTITLRTLKRRALAFRTIPIPRTLCAELLALPAGRDGRLWTMHRVTAWRCVSAVAELTHIEGPMACPRGLRHGFGIHAAIANVPPNLIQRWMGHASPTTTAIYVDAVGIEERSFAERMWR